MFAHVSRSFLAAEDDERLEAVNVEVCLFSWGGGGGANQLTESWAWVVHVGGFHRGVVVHEE